MADKRDPSRPPPPAMPGGSSGSAMVDTFLQQARQLRPLAAEGPRGRLVFALDATMSRQPTWDLACRLQGEMFAAAATVGGLAVQLVYFRGFNECRSSQWVSDPQALTDLMVRISCRGGRTQIARVLGHARSEAERTPLKALIYVGDAMEEGIDELCSLAGELGLLGVKAFMFHEGHDPSTAQAFREIARLTGGAYVSFDAGAAQTLAGLLRAAAAYASGGIDALSRLAARDTAARRLLTSMGGRS